MFSLLQWAKEPQGDSAICGRRAFAALLVEVMAADSQWQAEEQDAVVRALRQVSGMDDGEAAQLLQMARAERREPVDLYEYTNIIRREYRPAQRQQMLEQLWQVAFADQHLDQHEEHLIRRIAELVGLRHSDFIRAKIRARDGGDD